MPNEEMAQYLGVFLDEANEQLGLLEQDILALENASTPELLQEIFRAAHTLKGSSRAMGFTSMGELTHAMEDVFDKLRKDELAATPAVVDALFQGLDLLKRQVAEVAATGDTQTPTDEPTGLLRAVMQHGAQEPASAALPPTVRAALTHNPLSQTAQVALQDARQAGCDIYRLTVHVADDCVMKSVRALMVLQSLETVASILATTPDEEAIENEQFAAEFGVLLATEHPLQDVERLVGSIAEIVAVESTRLDDRNEGGEALQGELSKDGHPSDLRFGPLPAGVREAACAATAEGLQLRAVGIKIADDCVMKSVRALMVLQSLETVASILATTPDEEAIENEQFAAEFGVLLATGRPVEEVLAISSALAEIVVARSLPLPQELAAMETAGCSTVAGREETPPKAPEQTASMAPTAAPGAPAPLAGDGAPAPGDAAASRASGTPPQSQTVRVDVVRLDNLLNLVGELVIDQTRIAQVASRMDSRYSGDTLLETLNDATAHFGRITSELQTEIMKARMLPIDHVFNRFPRMMRDLAQKLNKEMEFVIEGRETELDRSVIEVIGDPLIHLLRNSVDHGIEPPEVRKQCGKSVRGTVWLRARHEENYIVIEIQDDGRGMDPEALKSIAIGKGLITTEAASRMSDKEAYNLIFSSGFSTATVVSDVSGRGVGMDIVKSNLTRFGALIDIESRFGSGSTFTIKLPLTLAIIRGLLVMVGDGVYTVPLGSVLETIKVANSQIHLVNGREVILQRGSTLPLVRLHDLYYGARGGSATKGRATNYVVVVGVAERRIGLMVDSLLGEQEIVIKSLGKFIGDIRGISGATILGDGQIALIIDVNGLITIVTEERVGRYAA